MSGGWAPLNYEQWSGPDKVAGEGKGISVTGKDDPARGWIAGCRGFI